jgi:hypothetical protein
MREKALQCGAEDGVQKRRSPCQTASALHLQGVSTTRSRIPHRRRGNITTANLTYSVIRCCSTGSYAFSR